VINHTRDSAILTSLRRAGHQDPLQPVVTLEWSAIKKHHTLFFKDAMARREARDGARRAGTIRRICDDYFLITSK
jgi:hypothetical protein